jgi:hypothetical protein
MQRECFEEEEEEARFRRRHMSATLVQLEQMKEAISFTSAMKTNTKSQYSGTRLKSRLP